MNHRFHPEALNEWHEAAAYYMGMGEDLGDEFVDAIREAVGIILDSPHRWPPFTEHTQAYRLHRFPYRLVYSIERPETVFIASVMHTSRDSGFIEQRLRGTSGA
jgi:mRNA-degrading endonuclease RelE of RelBE toxin-antitoxin system